MRTLLLLALVAIVIDSAPSEVGALKSKTLNRKLPRPVRKFSIRKRFITHFCPMTFRSDERGGAVVARRAHNPEVNRSKLFPAITMTIFLFLYLVSPCFSLYEMEDSNLRSLL